MPPDSTHVLASGEWSPLTPPPEFIAAVDAAERRTPTLPPLPAELYESDLIRMCKLFHEHVGFGADDREALRLAVCVLLEEIGDRRPPKSWADAVAIEPKLETLLYLAQLRPLGRPWADRSFFRSQLESLVGAKAREPRLRRPEIAWIVRDTVFNALED